MYIVRQGKGVLLWFFCISLLLSVANDAAGQDTLALREKTVPLPVLRVDNAEAKFGEQVTVNLVLQAAPLGIKRLEVHLFLDNPMLATLIRVASITIQPEFFQILEQTTSSVHFRAVDFEDSIGPATSELIIASFIFETQATGTSTISMVVSTFVDDANNAIDPTVVNGTLTVVGGDRAQPVEGQRSPDPLPNALPPQDLDQDGLFEDLNGDGRFTQEDLLLLMKVVEDPDLQPTNAAWFDFNQDGELNPDDVTALFNQSTIFQVGLQQTNVNQTALVKLVLLQAPQGLRQFDITIELTTPGNIRLVGLAGTLENTPHVEVIEATTNSIRLQVSDFFDLVRPGEGPIVFTEVALESHSRGTSPIRISVNAFLDDANQSSFPIAMDGWVAFVNGPNRLASEAGVPQDLDGDGVFEDVNGDGIFDLDDPTFLGFHLDSNEVQKNVQFFDFNGDGQVDFDDVTTLASLAIEP